MVLFFVTRRGSCICFAGVVTSALHYHLLAKEIPKNPDSFDAHAHTHTYTHLFDPSMSALPISETQKSQSARLFARVWRKCAVRRIRIFILMNLVLQQ